MAEGKGHYALARLDASVALTRNPVFVNWTAVVWATFRFLASFVWKYR